ncbi:MAG: hypothetical protein RIS56_2149 [Verrucomicrobiota bacterium]
MESSLIELTVMILSVATVRADCVTNRSAATPVYSHCSGGYR